MSAPLDPERLLRCFAGAHLRYVVMGGLAVNAYGVIRGTKDVDICPDPARANLERLASVLLDLQAAQIGIEDFGADEVAFDPTKVDDLVEGGNFRLRTRLGDLDVMQWISGVPGEVAYATLEAEAMLVALGDLRVPVCPCATYAP